MTTKPAVYAVNRYTWAILKANLGWTLVNNMVPIIPANQEPEFAQYNKPFVVYGTASEWPGPMWWLQHEQCAYTIYSTSVGEINNAVRALNEAFIRMDEAAFDVNRFKDLMNDNGHSGTYFKSFEIVSSQSAGALEEEGGRQSGLVVIRYKYTTEPELDFTPPLP